MATLALTDALPDFGATKAVPAQHGTHGRPAAPTASQRSSDTREIEDAVAKAEAALAERLKQEHDEKLSAERQRHREEVEALERQLGSQAGEVIAARFAEMERQTIGLTTGLAARILGAALSEDLQKQAIERLSELIAEALNDREAVRVNVRGTAFLCGELRKALGERAAQVTFTEAPGLDLSAQIDENLLETRMAEWSEALAEVLS